MLDLRLRFGVEAKEYTDRACIVVLEVAAHSGMVMTGVVVDVASEVLNIKGEGIEDMPSFRTNLDSEYILRITKG